MSQFCGTCGAPVLGANRFCSRCGAAYTAVAPPPPPTPEIEWHYSVGGITTGPVAESELRRMLETMPAGVQVWNASLAGWTTAEEAGLKRPMAMAAAAPQGFVVSAPQPVAAPAPRQGTPVPPEMHWVVVLILTWVTGGLAGLIWAFRQASFVKKIDRESKATLLLALATVAMVVQVAAFLVAATMNQTAMVAALGVIMLLNLVVCVASLIAVFSMRSSIVRYYNSVEPVGLQLSGVMTFFFSIFYFQYHFGRILDWKRTGRFV